MPDFMQEWWFLGLMTAVLVGLIVVLMIVRKKRPEDD